MTRLQAAVTDKRRSPLVPLHYRLVSMPKKPTRSTRRDFLKGKSAIDAVEDLGREVARAGDSTDRKGAEGEQPDRSRSYLVQIGRRAMACQFELLLNAGHDPAATDHAIAALDLVDELEEQLSVYRHHSEVSQLNAIAQRRPVRVESRLFDLLMACREIYERTDRAFDMTSGPLIRIWREARREACLPTASSIDEARQCVGSDKIHFNVDQRTVRFLEMGVTIDLGGIGKGYALDRCAEQLDEANVGDYLMHGGTSSILARGQRQSGTGRPGWTVGVQHPLRADRRLLELDLCDQAVATSGAGTHQFYVKGRRYGHILDPRTGYPVDGILSTTVVAPQAAQADALSTSFYVMGLDAVSQYCAEHHDVAALITTLEPSDGSLRLHTFNSEKVSWRDHGFQPK